MANITDINAGNAVVKIVADDHELQKALGQSTKSLESFGDLCLKIGMRLQATGQVMLQPFLRSAEIFEGFQRQMLRVGAVTGLAGDALDEMADKAMAAGRAAGFTAQQTAGVMGALGMMGFTAAEIQDTTDNMLKLARVTGIDAAEAAAIASNNMRVFGFAAKDASAVADILAATANGSAQTLTDLGEALKMAGPIAKMSGASLRETAAQGALRRIRVVMDGQAANVFVDGVLCTGMAVVNVSGLLQGDQAMARLDRESGGIIRNSGIIVKPDGSARVKALRMSVFPDK